MRVRNLANHLVIEMHAPRVSVLSLQRSSSHAMQTDDHGSSGAILIL